MRVWNPDRTSLHRSTGLLLAVALLSLPLSGCATWDLRGPGFQGETANIGHGLRSSSGGELWGLDERARQIERNTGI